MAEIDNFIPDKVSKIILNTNNFDRFNVILEYVFTLIAFKMYKRNFNSNTLCI